ncbi:pol, partial [Symbiodinium sp. CCMP2456]
GVALELRAKNQHADMAERHNEVLRRQIHLLDTNATNEGLRVSFGALLAEAVFAKNILFNMGGASPYEAVFGRTPPLITVVTHESPDFIDDRDADRLRHLAIQSMTQASAEMKARRANATKTRRAGELLGLEAGDLVDFWRRASSKDLECWQGPAVVTDVTSLKTGQITIRWQGRLGWFKNSGVWRPFEANGRSVSALPGVSSDESFLLWWNPGMISEWNHAHIPGTQHINISRLCGHREHDIFFVQFFMEDDAAIAEIRQVVHDVPNLGGIHDPALPRLRDLTTEVRLRQRQHQLAIEDQAASSLEPEVFDIATPDSERTAEDTGDESDFESMFSAFSSQPPVVSADAPWEPCFVFAISDVLSEPPELEFSFTSAPLLQGVAVLPQPHETLIFTLGEKPHAVMWNVHQAWRRGPRSGAHNALASKWVLKWKPIGGVRTVKVQLLLPPGSEELIRTLPGMEDFDSQKEVEYDNFEHLGLKHSLHDDGSRSVSQQHYVQELRPIPEAELKLRSLSEVASEDMKHLFMSLLGGVAWVVQTRPDVAVFVAALQRSGIVALTSRAGVQQGKNRLQVLEFTTKKQSKVWRSTFAAELYSSLDLLGVACVINAAITEVLQGPKTAAQLVEMQESGNHSLLLDAVIDARSVWQSAASDEPKCGDQLVALHLHKLREIIRTFVDRYVWCDTRSMLADGLTKGIIDRQPLRRLAAEGIWMIEQALEIHQQRSCATEDQRHSRNDS